MKAVFVTLGCKVNQYETQVLEEKFAKAGIALAKEGEKADFCIVNSCTVTASGDKKTRQMLRRLKRQYPDAVMVLTGCYPQAFPQEASELEEADIVTGSTNRSGLLDLVQAYLQTPQRMVQIIPHQKGEAFEKMTATHFSERTRAFVKIQDGCDRYCAYCIIPYARGPVRSKPLSDITAELGQLAAQGYQEVVLVGINLPCYGKDLGLRLIDAVEAACQVEGIRRIRLGSLEPELLTAEDLKRLAAQPKFCPQFHLSLQSGCDRTLKAMNRHYDSAEYRRIVQDIRKAFENPSITTDIMVGFPGETEEDFRQSADFAKEIGLAKAHVFAYSVRPGTRAASMPDQVSQREKEQRSSRLIEVTNATRQAFLQAQVGREEEVLFETTQTPYGIEGYTPNYTPVCVEAHEDIRGQIRRVRITAALNDLCLGELV
ncbi:MAG: tRNA (N(6)-L-threonylcarbamoyladenosine(37)-C(2))-methylthiotransferase MtaB [Oscillospiraceae bacterium]|nr:tRNA (N(6)-L-threonylcarbamoyladenosine(37)-C(2))-methylthiotransferase MtaB [Oscillospiraceae bacterium]MDD5920769.1 tRNA (N(6)-L-threonylcarbamoyladenosine(37)-C(2))-methylthiotransferase MtaB [Oscillospiraceae bacterium]HAG57273.1 tRNA (N(6)-L-threonylcarbamoyladenosine(37)-C(2))-methylthiotransferase MtaB [Oscillospiraceae bacterium]HCU32769.1 tRNA (N(6)-L-threonylcarbamoyladenosine(37)-C(2))-methylthiotransferase MtaB [Oscillospiraceae bacterium]